MSTAGYSEWPIVLFADGKAFTAVTTTFTAYILLGAD